jgi:outer membrane receptor protein involved in Fe transport
MLLATTFLVVSWDAATMRGVAQDQPSPEAAARDANAQAINLDTISVDGGSGRAEGYFTPSTSVATKTNTPLINIPQSLTW